MLFAYTVRDLWDSRTYVNERERKRGVGVTLVILLCGVVEGRGGGALLLSVTVRVSVSPVYCHNMTQTADILLFMPVKFHEACQH
jgi:hypothetical protein